MGEIGISVTASELNYQALTEDLGNILSAEAMGRVANEVYGDMKDSLQEHIRTDVYSEYKPKVYKRRREYAGFGPALINIDRNSVPIIKPGKGGAQVGIIYMPSGEHERERWHTADGDDLIGRIEKKDPPYTWDAKKRKPIPPRPFWQNFVDEMVGSGFAASVSRAFKGEGIEISDISVEREPEDGNY